MTEEAQPTTDVLDDTFVEALAVLDERLRNGESLDAVDISVGCRDAGEANELFACLQLLERTYSRADRKPEPETFVSQYLGRFQLLEILGQGGFGVVYLARDPLLGRQIALKVPRLHTLSNPSLNERFLREARAVAALDHPHILPILEAGEIGPVCYIASAYCEGGDLAHWIKAQAPVESAIAAKIVATLADATHYSHSKGILHRDLKPSNVLMATQTAATGTMGHNLPFALRLTDFGLARLTEESLGETGSTILGTPTYMSPEQAAGHNSEVSASTDVYALGVILYELLTGRPPFVGTGFIEVSDQIRSDEPLSPCRLVRSVPQDLETICLNCLKKEPLKRYATAADLRDDLQRFLRHEPVRAKPVSMLERARKWGRRHPARLIALLVSIVSTVMLVCGLALHLYQVEHHLTVTENLRIAGKKREEKLRAQAYGGEVEAAATEVFAGLPHLAQRRLSQFIPHKSDTEPMPDLRGPEWYYLNQLSKPTLPAASLRGHNGAVFSVAINPQGNLVASGDGKGIIKIWDIPTGKELKSLQAHEGEVRGLDFTPDGKYLASGGSYHAIRVWNVTDWSRAAEITAHDGSITSLEFGPEGDRILSSGRDGYVYSWEWRTGKKLWSHEVGEVVQAARYARNGKQFYAVSDEAKLTIPGTDRVPGTKKLQEVFKHPTFGTGMRILAIDTPTDGNIIVGGGYGGELVCFDRRNYQQWTLPVGQAISSAVFQEDGRVAVLGGLAGWIYFLKFETDTVCAVKLHRWRGHEAAVEDLKLSADGSQIVSASYDGSVRIWNVSDVPPAEVTMLIEPRHKPEKVTCHTIAFVDRRLAIAGAIGDRDGFIHMWDMENLQQNHFSKCANFPIEAIRSVPNSKRLLGASLNRGLLIWDDPTTETLPRIIENPRIWDIAPSSDGETLAVAERAIDGTSTSILLHSATTGNLIRKLYSGPAQPGGMAFSPDGQTFIAAFGDMPLRFIDLHTGDFQVAVGLEHGSGNVRFNSTGSQIVVNSGIGHYLGVGWSKHTFIIDALTRTVTSAFYSGSHLSTKRVFALSPDGRLLAISVVEAGAEIVIWHLPTGRAVLRLSPFGTLPVQLEFSEDGKYLAATTVHSSSDEQPPPPNTFIWKLVAQ